MLGKTMATKTLPENFKEAIDVFNAELPNEVPCLLTDIIVITDTIIVVDNENKKVKRFSADKRLIDAVCLEDPCGVAKLHLSSHLVVTEPLQRQITFISLEDDKMSVSSYRRTRRRYQSVCCLDEMRIVVGCCDLGQGALDILDYEGVVLSCIEFEGQGRRLFRTPACLVAYPDAKHILISDAGHRKLFCMSPEGAIEFSHDPKGTPSGICVSPGGEVYLCLYDKNIIQQLNVNCASTCENFTEEMGLKHPLTICATDNLLLVTEEMPSGRIFVVNLEACAKKYDKAQSVKLSHIHVTLPATEKAEDSNQNQPSDLQTFTNVEKIKT